MWWKQNWKLASRVCEARVWWQTWVSKTWVLVLSWSNLSTWNSSFSNLSSIELSADEDEEEPKNQIGSQNRRKNLEKQNRDLEKQRKNLEKQIRKSRMIWKTDEVIWNEEVQKQMRKNKGRRRRRRWIV